MSAFDFTCRLGVRDNPASLARAQGAGAVFGALWPAVRWERASVGGAGAPEDRDLDEAVRAGTLEVALVAPRADDAPVGEGLDWFWMTPPGDALVAPEDEAAGSVMCIFRAGDARWRRRRTLFVKPVVFVGGGPAGRELCTVAGVEALQACDVCLYDALVDPSLLDATPPGAVRISVGKRRGHHVMDQERICRLLALYARRGARVVRLKGGDPGLFGRLAEEIAVLDELELPYRVIPGVSSLSAATTGTGMLLTRRGASRGFCALTPRQGGGGRGPVDAAARAGLPLVLFMGVAALRDMMAQLAAERMPADTPVAVVFAAGGDDEVVVRGNLGDIAENVQEAVATGVPGLVLVGAPAATGYRAWGALGGRRVWLGCDAARRAEWAREVRDYDGRPLGLARMRSASPRIPGFEIAVFTRAEDVTAGAAYLPADAWTGKDLVAVGAEAQSAARARGWAFHDSLRSLAAACVAQELGGPRVPLPAPSVGEEKDVTAGGAG